MYSEHPSRRDLKCYYFWAVDAANAAMVGPIDATNLEQAKDQARYLFGAKFGNFPNELVQQ